MKNLYESTIKIIKKKNLVRSDERINNGITHGQKKVRTRIAIIVDIKIPLSGEQLSDMSRK